MNRNKFITWIKVTLHTNKKWYLHCNEYARQGTGLVINSSMCNTHSAATNKYNKEALDGTARAHDPRHPNEEDNTEDIL